jgi:hypothetical protein
MEKFLYLKLGFGNCLAEYWLNKDNVVKNIFKRPVAAIYFGPVKAEEYRKIIHISDKEKKRKKEEYVKLCTKHKMGKKDKARKKALFQLNQIKEFFEAGENVGKKGVQRTTFVTIARDTVYIYEPESCVRDMEKYKYDRYDNDLSKLSKKYPALKRLIDKTKVRPDGPTGEIKNKPKYIHVKIVRKCKVEKLPHVLATLPCNQYYTRGTCREIKRKDHWGAIQAIKNCLGKQIEHPDTHKLMDLLSPYELETLVFLILRNKNLFVPAWRGGTQKDIDIIGRNLHGYEIKISPVTFKPKGQEKADLTFQVKKGKVEKGAEFVANWVVATDYKEENGKILGAKWLLKQIRTQPDTKKWFLDSLSWVPNIKSLINNIS